MSTESWLELLPKMFASAGIEMTAGLTVTPLTGGVSSDIVRIELADGREFCAKRALSQLKVKSDWRAPVERNHYEIAWLRRAGAIMPGAAPTVFAEDRARGIALLEYLPPDDYVLWKTELLAGHANPDIPVAVAEALGRIHRATLDDAGDAEAFRTDHLIEALRLDPYLRFTASRHPQLGQAILAVLDNTMRNKRALVHGDVSPKNILVSRRDGHPVLLDAECAWFGDPAFDAAFCLNHLILKAVHMRALTSALLAQAAAFADTWLGHFPAAERPAIEARTAALLPCLMLARVDGKSPVEYLGAADQSRVRNIAVPLIVSPPAGLRSVLAAVG